MVTLGKRSGTLESSVSAKHINDDEAKTSNGDEISGYEQCREKRIKANMERMQKLGILDLSRKLKSLPSYSPSPRKQSGRKTPQLSSPLSLSGPSRRSSRLQSVTPISYSEVDLSEKILKDKNRRKPSLNDIVLMEDGSKPEVYTEEHEKLLGSCQMSWTLFVDGCGKDGRRIYDQVSGKTCHQCRQKTLGHRTHCSSCNMVQGQFCGDCLYMRYGEHVLEANQNPNWICPVCRGICNCSLCRQAKGWPPTGALYRKIANLGFKSVAHYLIQTRRAETTIEKEEDSTTCKAVSAKKSLPFSDKEERSEEKEPHDPNECHKLSTPRSKYQKEDTEMKSETQETKIDSSTALTGSRKLEKKPSSFIEPDPNSIGARLRRRRSEASACLESKEDCYCSQLDSGKTNHDNGIARRLRPRLKIA